jgi:ParB family transcriptional regulator, chromosome partitioning protein
MNKELNQSQRKALGKGLSALLPPKGSSPRQQASPPPLSPPVPAPTPVRPDLPAEFESFQSIPISEISPNESQPRTSWDLERMEELAQSIRANGLIQPITVTQSEPGKYQIVAGERRWRAARMAGLTEIPAMVRTIEQNKRLELALIENIQREDLNPIETAAAFSQLIQQHQLSHEQVAERTGKDRSTITNFLRLLKLPKEVQEDLGRGDISMGHARALLGLPNEGAQRTACQQILDKRLSVRETERLVKEWTTPKPDGGERKAKSEPPLDANVRAALEAMEAALGTKVRLIPKAGKGTSGRLEIDYYSQDDLDRIYAAIVR